MPQAAAEWVVHERIERGCFVRRYACDEPARCLSGGAEVDQVECFLRWKHVVMSFRLILTWISSNSNYYYYYDFSWSILLIDVVATSCGTEVNWLVAPSPDRTTDVRALRVTMKELVYTAMSYEWSEAVGGTANTYIFLDKCRMQDQWRSAEKPLP